MVARRLCFLQSCQDIVEGLRSRLLEEAPDVYSPPQWADVSAEVPFLVDHHWVWRAASATVCCPELLDFANQSDDVSCA